jgi:hypothetical protein
VFPVPVDFMSGLQNLLGKGGNGAPVTQAPVAG